VLNFPQNAPAIFEVLWLGGCIFNTIILYLYLFIFFHDQHNVSYDVPIQISFLSPSSGVHHPVGSAQVLILVRIAIRRTDISSESL